MNCTFPSKHSPETNNMTGQMFHSYKQIFIADIMDPSRVLWIYQPPNSVCVGYHVLVNFPRASEEEWIC